MEKRESTFNLSRYFASIIADIVILYGVSIASVIIIGFVAGGISNLGLEALIVIDIFTIWYFYYCVIFRKTGQTVSMRIFNLKVQTKEKKIAFSTALVWGIINSNPLTVIFSIIFIFIPPNLTFLERFTNTYIIEEL